MVSDAVDTGAPVEALFLPIAVNWFMARLRAASMAMDATLVVLAAVLFATVPATALVDCTPPTAPPEVLT